MRHRPHPDRRRDRSTPLRRPWRAGLAFVLTAAVVSLSAGRASANTETAIKISVGQTVTKSFSDLVGDDGEGDAYEQAGNANYTSNAQDPSDCDPLPSCDDIPVVLNLPNSALGSGNPYLLEISITYEGGPGANTPLGTQTANTVAGSLWDNPIPAKGPHANGQDASCFTDPCGMNEAQLDTNSLSLVADQITGSADAFKLTLKLVDVSSGPGSCPGVSGGEGAPACPAGGSGGGSTGGGAPAPSGAPAQPVTASPAPFDSGGALPPTGSAASLPSPSSIGLALPSFAVQTGGPNPVLSALSSVQVGSVLGIGGKSLKQGTFLGIPAARPASNLAVVLSLVATPALLAVASAFMFVRRRRLSV